MGMVEVVSMAQVSAQRGLKLWVMSHVQLELRPGSHDLWWKPWVPSQILTNRSFCAKRNNGPLITLGSFSAIIRQQPSSPSLQVQPGFVEDLVTPCYVGYLSIIQRNSERMLRRARHLGCQLRPHMKTHKTLQGGGCWWFLGARFEGLLKWRISPLWMVYFMENPSETDNLSVIM